MALTADKKVAIAHRIFDLATKKYGIRPVDLLFDTLTLPISTGQEEYRSAGIETLKAVKRIHDELPEVKTVLGVSNISFGLDAYPRRVLNSVFLHRRWKTAWTLPSLTTRRFIRSTRFLRKKWNWRAN
jgi:5-methyltetrahydrofolate--homocysteine methyltransferase